MEAQFTTNAIIQDLTKFYHALQALDADILAEVSELVTNPPASNKYKVLKACILREFQDSEEKCLKTLLNQTELGNQRPSCLLRHMKDLVENKVYDELLKSLWMQRLSTNTQTILSTSEDTLEKLATMADRIHDIVSTNVCMEVTPAATGTSPWEGQLSEIIKRLDRMESKRRKASPRRRERSGSRSRTRSTSASSGHCWYHKYFDQKAKKCTSPCNWKNKSFLSE